MQYKKMKHYLHIWSLFVRPILVSYLLSSCLYKQDPAEAPSSELRLDLFGGGQ